MFNEMFLCIFRSFGFSPLTSCFRLVLVLVLLLYSFHQVYLPEISTFATKAYSDTHVSPRLFVHHQIFFSPIRVVNYPRLQMYDVDPCAQITNITFCRHYSFTDFFHLSSRLVLCFFPRFCV